MQRDVYGNLLQISRTKILPFILFIILFTVISFIAACDGEAAHAENKPVNWYLVSGYNGPPREYIDHISCEPTAIWYYDGTIEKWFAWFPQFEDPHYIAVPEAYNYMIDWMYVDRGYWVAC